tara:strand:- start:1052 stop:2191 length:1140 start_codon:yes stop_codon:yes gene_type:complete
MNKQPNAKFWHSIHSWVGLKLSLLMTFILLTGSIAVFSAEIDWFFLPEMRSPDSTPSAQAAWGAGFDAVRESYPKYELDSLSRYLQDYIALQVVANTPWNELVRIWVEPADGTISGVTQWYNVQRFLRNLHRHLMMPNNIGIPIVTVMAFPLLISLIAGFFIYKKFWKGIFKRPRFELKARIWLGDLHRLIGLWGSWFVALIIITSIWYFVEELGGSAPPFPAPAAYARGGSSDLPPNFSGNDLDQAVELALIELPGLQIRRISLGETIIIEGDLTANFVRPRANSVYIDSLNLKVLGSYRGEELGLHNRISEAADPLHFGYFGGLTTKIIWFFLGIFMTALSITGFMIYGARLGKIALSSKGRKINNDSESEEDIQFS